MLETVEWAPSSDLADMHGTDDEAARRATTRLQAPDSPPWFAAYYENASMRQRVAALSRDSEVVLFEGSDMALFMDAVAGEARLCVDLMDVYSSIAKREADRTEGPAAASSRAEAERVLRYERDVVRRADLCLTVSTREAQTATRTLGGAAVEVIANGVDVRYYTPSSVPAEGGHVLFTGSLNYPPNIEAARYFHDEIFPSVMEGCARRDIPYGGDDARRGGPRPAGRGGLRPRIGPGHEADLRARSGRGCPAPLGGRDASEDPGGSGRRTADREHFSWS